MHLTVNQLTNYLLQEVDNLKALTLELKFRKMSDQPIERLEHEIRKCQTTIEIWTTQLNERLQGV
jgi:hypothetical protein